MTDAESNGGADNAAQDATVTQVAALRFLGSDDDADGGQDSGGELILFDDGTVQLLPSDRLRDILMDVSEQVSSGAVKWGASLVVGLAAAGAALMWRGKRSGGFAVFAAAAAAGLGAFALRRNAEGIAAEMF